MASKQQRWLGWALGALLVLGGVGSVAAQGPFPAAITAALQALGLFGQDYGTGDCAGWSVAQGKYIPTACSGGGSGGAPSDATYLTQTSNVGLSAEQAIGGLASGIMRVATTTGVVTSLTTSAGIAANISDETGSGALVFGTSPTFNATVNTRIADPDYIYATWLNTSFSVNPADAMIMVDYGGGYLGFENFPTGQAGTYLYFNPTDGRIDVNKLRTDTLNGSPSGVLKVFPKTTGGFLQAEVAIPTPLSDEYTQTGWLITALRDSTDGYFDANFRFGATVNGTVQVPSYSFGSEGNLSAGGAFTVYRAYMYDQINERSIWHIDNSDAQTFIFDDTIDVLVAGGTLTVTGGEGANGVVQIAADQGDDATDTWQLSVAASGNAFSFINNAVALAALSTAGVFSAVTVQPTTSYKSVDGTAGVTVTTCTGFKNGLCISGT